LIVIGFLGDNQVMEMDRRKVYSIVLKLLALLGVVIIMAVMINSLFPVVEDAEETEEMVEAKPQTVKVLVSSLFAGKMKHTQWAGKSVGILKRINPPANFIAGEPLNSEWRSVKAEYFVFYNKVGVAQCPLYLMSDGQQLKDTCTGILYDTTGKRVTGSGSLLEIPPYYFDEDATLVIGEWGSRKKLKALNLKI
jgi:hypothetical protein